jgi:hypothetical protein
MILFRVIKLRTFIWEDYPVPSVIVCILKRGEPFPARPGRSDSGRILRDAALMALTQEEGSQVKALGAGRGREMDSPPEPPRKCSLV